MRVVVTAGHVDHGKSTLVRELTGRDPDRFAEEKVRGLTIDLGFAWTTLPSGVELAIVDVPGHVRFLKNMLAGVGMVDACLFVVDASEGWKPQSEEHLRILELVGIAHGIVVVTKVGLVDAAWCRMVRDDVADHLAGTFLASAEVVEADVVEGLGLDRLRAALDRLVGEARAAGAVERGRPRLWIDRSFVARGSGTVVTGTLTGGGLRTGDQMVVVPGDRPVRVRGLQALEQAHEVVPSGSRVAVNVTGAGRADVPRGHALVGPGQWRPTTMVDASLAVLASLDHEVTRRGAYVVYVGSGEHQVTLLLLGERALLPGEEGFVRLYLPVALPLVLGDRYVLREHGRSETVGGGEVFDVAPVLPAAKARPSGAVDDVVAERGWVDVDDLEAMTGRRLDPTVGRWVVAPDAQAAVETSIREAVAAAGPFGLDVARLDARQRAVLTTLDDLSVDLGLVRNPAAGGADALIRHAYLDALEAALFTPPPAVGVDRADLHEWVRRGLVVERDGVWFASSAIERAIRIVAELLAAEPGGFTTSQARKAFGTSRKYALPLLAHLDSIGATRRQGDVRVAAPRLARLLGAGGTDDRDGGEEGGGGRESNPPSQGRYDHPL